MTGYSILIAIGAGLGLLQVYRNGPEKQAARRVNAGLLALLGGLVGARLWFVLLRPEYFSAHLGEIPQMWQGGLSWPGAAVGGLLVLGLLSLAWQAPLLPLADSIAPGIAPLAVMAWLGCWLSGSAYGAQVPAGTWWGIMARDETGLTALRWPVQPLAAVSLAAAYSLLSFWKKKPGWPGWLASVSLLALALDLLAFSLLIVEPSPFWRGLRPETWAAGGLAAAALVGLAASWLARPAGWKERSSREMDAARASAGSED